MQSIKVVAVGDKGVGKACLLRTYITGGCSENITCEDFSKEIIIDDKNIIVMLYDITGQEDYEILRSGTYKDADAFLLCFSLVSPESLENIKNIWKPDISKENPNVPCILVGLQAEMRDEFDKHAEDYRNEGFSPVPTSKGEEMKNEVEAVKYIECSCRDQKNVSEVFFEAAKVGVLTVHEIPGTNGGCCLVM